jgi:cell division protein FtsL
MSRIATAFSTTWGNTRSQRVEALVSALNTTRVRVVCLALIGVLLLTYLWLVNSAATSGFYLSDLETKRVALDDEYKKLQVEQTALRSLDHIQEESQNMKMVASSKVQYMQDSSVALGK